MKVVFVTANPSQIDCGGDCAIGYIRKPFSEAAILAAAAMASDDGYLAPANDDIVMLRPAAG
jgi:hypothetical protein